MTYTTRAGLTTSDHCHEPVAPGWRSLAEHTTQHLTDAGQLAKSRALGRQEKEAS